MMSNFKRCVILAQLLMIAGLILVACGSPATSIPVTQPTATPIPIIQPTAAATLSEQEVATLNSLKKVDDFPLYTMHYYGSSEPGWSGTSSSAVWTNAQPLSPWACSLFAALGGGEKLYGRNFDWVHSPALLLFTHPTNGYASVSMVDLAYLGFGDKVNQLTELPLDQRQALLNATAWPFDGMNERGLVVGMAAVPDGNVRPDLGKETIDSLQVIRKMLDQAGTVDEAVAVLQQVNIDWGSGPALHYLIADRSGQSALVEFYQGKIHIITTDKPWHLATNFLVSSVGKNVTGQCPRYDKLDQRLSTAAGSVDTEEALHLLRDVSQVNTQWSIVYGLSTGEIVVTMGREYNRRHTFKFDHTD
jgi:Acyl-coenzyme A:6-aminopenicillanic acid acyl-transferase